MTAVNGLKSLEAGLEQHPRVLGLPLGAHAGQQGQGISRRQALDTGVLRVGQRQVGLEAEPCQQMAARPQRQVQDDEVTELGFQLRRRGRAQPGLLAQQLLAFVIKQPAQTLPVMHLAQQNLAPRHRRKLPLGEPAIVGEDQMLAIGNRVFLRRGVVPRSVRHNGDGVSVYGASSPPRARGPRPATAATGRTPPSRPDGTGSPSAAPPAPARGNDAAAWSHRKRLPRATPGATCGS